MKENTLGGPTDSQGRIPTLDVLRGFAVLGIFVVNIEIMNCIFMNQDAFAGQWTSAPDRLAVRILQLFFYSKFFPIFSFLFGLGIAMQALKRMDRGIRSGGFFLRRMAALFVIGALHVILLWGGDVVHMYAVLGVLTLLVFRVPSRVILLASVALLCFPYYEELSGTLFRYLNFQPASYLEAYSSEEAVRIIREGSYLEGVRFRLHEYVANMPLLYSFMAPVAFSMFLLGVYAGKKRVVKDIPAFLNSTKWGYISVFVLTNAYRVVFLFVLPDTGVFKNSDLGPVLYRSMFLCDIAMGLCYLWGVAWLMQKQLWVKLLSPLAYAGRMALTNYLMQSLIGLLIFSSIGLGLYETLSPWQTLVMALGVFIFQLLFSMIWLRAFRFGPVEYVWRALTYLYWPRIKKKSGEVKAFAK
ncbi:DUF418 domain-containing protein [Roseivirga sp. BDSF3-8]|uniref:DUF418 domain-containing protein n=1 Tax=Roseivirga sp. BDSF3-8 TaxID=3241598 RepID=UPI003531F39C